MKKENKNELTIKFPYVATEGEDFSELDLYLDSFSMLDLEIPKYKCIDEHSDGITYVFYLKMDNETKNFIKQEQEKIFEEEKFGIKILVQFELTIDKDSLSKYSCFEEATDAYYRSYNLDKPLGFIELVKTWGDESNVESSIKFIEQ